MCQCPFRSKLTTVNKLDSNCCHVEVDCCEFQPAFGCCALHTLVEICFVNIFHTKGAEKGQKAKNEAKFSKKLFIKFAPKCWLRVLFPD